jgi:hypothetical protein
MSLTMRSLTKMYRRWNGAVWVWMAMLENDWLDRQSSFDFHLEQQQLLHLRLHL